MWCGSFVLSWKDPKINQIEMINSLSLMFDNFPANNPPLTSWQEWQYQADLALKQMCDLRLYVFLTGVTMKSRQQNDETIFRLLHWRFCLFWVIPTPLYHFYHCISLGENPFCFREKKCDYRATYKQNQFTFLINSSHQNYIKYILADSLGF